MALGKAEAFVKPLRVDTGVMRQQLDQLAAPGARFADRPLHELLADAAAASIGGDADILDQAARGALRAQARHNAELEAADHPPRIVLGDDQREVAITLDLVERGKIAIRQRLFEPLARAAKMVIGQHRDDSRDVVATCAADGNGGC